jgi:hypothetical protein
MNHIMHESDGAEFVWAAPLLLNRHYSTRLLFSHDSCTMLMHAMISSWGMDFATNIARALVLLWGRCTIQAPLPRSLPWVSILVWQWGSGWSRECILGKGSYWKKLALGDAWAMLGLWWIHSPVRSWKTKQNKSLIL